MKVEIPNELKADVPQTTFGKVLSATPVVMAVVATMLAGLSSSEMTRAQYDRSLAAQQQSKAGDQWSFFQAKRLRGAYNQNTAELLQSLTEVHMLEGGALKRWAEGKQALADLLGTQVGGQALEALQKAEVPGNAAAVPVPSPEIQRALKGLESLQPDTEMARLLAPVSDQALENALRAAQNQSEALDAATVPINRAIDQIDRQMGQQAASAGGGGLAGGASVVRDFAVARLRYTAARYEVEARLNQGIAGIYELQVRKSNMSAERQHARSQRFFFGMLGAQLGVIVSTFAMAARKRNLLWSVAAGVGLLAVAFAIYVYLCL